MLFVKARAKINWTLDILGRRADGYHLLDMLMQSVELHDTLWLEESDELTLEAADDSAPGGLPGDAAPGDGLSAPQVRYDESNLALRAARALQAACGVTKGARMRLRKSIPCGAGMGGGSADAAAALVGLNRLWELGLTDAALCEIGLALGADVPFLLAGGLARVGGIGERIAPLAPAPRWWLAVAQPCDGLSTREVFQAYDALPPGGARKPRTDEAQAALLRGDLPALGAAMGNALEAVSAARRPQIGEAARALEAAGAARAMMTGSGSAVYGVFPSREGATRARDTLRAAYPNCVVTRCAQTGPVVCAQTGPVVGLAN